ncbi:MAG: superoxide dismutase [Sphingobacteriia bacterium]|nr:superoxide dismutase [Sphingobacteriia bacterium]
MSTLVKDLSFPELGYSYSALEPHIDAMTMEIHYTRHHKAYYDNLQNAVKGTEMADVPFLELLKNISRYPMAVRNNGGGHFNHELFWTLLSSNGGGMPQGALLDAIVKKYNSFDEFKEKFSDAAKTRFGSGWAWLMVKSDGSLAISSTPNQDNPYMDVVECRGIPVMGLDVWEHAYYLKYQNKRPDYVAAYWNVIDWKQVEKYYSDAIKSL